MKEKLHEIEVKIYYTELISFGPYAMAGDAFSVSDELTSLLCSSASFFSNDSPATECGFLTWVRFMVTLSSLSGIFENRCVYLNTIGSFSTELSDGRMRRSGSK